MLIHVKNLVFFYIFLFVYCVVGLIVARLYLTLLARWVAYRQGNIMVFGRLRINSSHPKMKKKEICYENPRKNKSYFNLFAT